MLRSLRMSSRLCGMRAFIWFLIPTLMCVCVCVVSGVPSLVSHVALGTFHISILLLVVAGISLLFFVWLLARRTVSVRFNVPFYSHIL